MFRHAKLFKKMASLATVLAALAFSATQSSAQVPPTEALATWNPTGLGNGGGAPPAPFTNNSAAANVIVTPMMKGTTPGTTLITTTNVYGGAGWTNAGVLDSEAGSIADGYYITYSIQAAPGYFISFYSNVFYYHNSATGPTNGMLQYSTDGMNYMDITYLSYAKPDTAATAGMTNILSTNQFLQNIPSTVTNFFRIVNWGTTNGVAGTWYINNANATNDYAIYGGVYSPNAVPPTNLVVTPSSITTNAGSTVSFSVAAQGTPPSYTWYQITGSMTNLLASQTNATLTLANLVESNAGSYFVVLSNAAGTATSSVVTLSVLDPYIVIEPVSSYGLLDGVAQFSIDVAGTGLTYQWYFSDSSGDLIATVPNGPQTSGSVVSGATTSTLTISNLQYADPTNFEVVVTGTDGSVTGSNVSLLSVGTSVPLVLWDFNAGTGFLNNLNNPPPFLGIGTAGPVGSTYAPGTSPFSGSVDPADGAGLNFPDGQDLPNYSWGTDTYPAAGSNKLSGVQFNVSTVGAQNIGVSYDSRVSATASDYERLQYTTDGVTWIDYPSSSTFGGVGSTYLTFTNNLTGFPGVANNPNFGIRIVSEIQSTATYGNVPNTNYLGTANTYGTGGTVSYDLVTIWGTSITNTYTPPTISSIANMTSPDYLPLTVNFTVSDPTTPPNLLTYSAVSLYPQKVNGNFSFSGTGTTNVTLTISPYQTPDSADTGPILVTVTDTNGFSAAAWFDLTLTSENLPPTNSLTSVTNTNTLVNMPLRIPFLVTDDRTPTNGQTFSYSATSDNNTLIPTGNIVLPASGSTSNVTVTIDPAFNQLGVAQIGISVDDNDLVDPKSTTANMSVMVRPNTNIVLIDYFTYDNSGSLDTVASGFWTHLSGTAGGLKVNSAPTGGYALVDTFDFTENLQAQLLGAPYLTNNTKTPVLYSSFTVNMTPGNMPIASGASFVVFNDGSGVTGDYECRVIAATNGAAPGYYRLYIDNWGGSATDAEAVGFPQDLAPGNTYVVVTGLVLTNGFSTLWIDPTNGVSSPSVTDVNTAAAELATLYNISDFELRESGTDAGLISLGHLKVGTTFDSVFPSLQIQASGTNVVLYWSDPTLGIQSSTNVAGPYTDVIGAEPPYTNYTGTNAAMFFKFGQ
jgi:hypothetical protein